ncbi:hypothetical protein N657DRAFT_8323 [Parathielavia appendiculata]|uniref:Uncharacterized protein n=1 Tax=Parathielavia appendiculata TaxID=2587402 RepID=A0AAN6Z7U3_9PEZI|nr:hypothetical protein N657DRAFT_8323 [Parathielavia appendiculata]
MHWTGCLNRSSLFTGTGFYHLQSWLSFWSRSLGGAWPLRGMPGRLSYYGGLWLKQYPPVTLILGVGCHVFGCGSATATGWRLYVVV